MSHQATVEDVKDVNDHAPCNEPQDNNGPIDDSDDDAVGCIYASNPRFKSNISQCCFFPSNLLSNYQNNSEIFSLIFLYFY